MSIDLNADPPVATLFSDDAEAFANRLNTAAGHQAKNKSTQIRRFYDELVSWQERIGDDNDKFIQYVAFIKMLNAKAAYAEGRNLVTPEFVIWFKDCIRQVNTPKALRNFRLHFEAVLGFLKSIRG